MLNRETPAPALLNSHQALNPAPAAASLFLNLDYDHGVCTGRLHPELDYPEVLTLSIRSSFPVA